MSNVPEVLTPDQANTLLDHIATQYRNTPHPARGLRNQLIALLLYDAGLRVGEVVKLRVADLCYDCRPVKTLTVRRDVAKGRHERDVPLTERVQALIEPSIHYCWPPDIAETSDYAFYVTTPSKHITVRQVERIIHSAAMACLGIPVHPHTLRHSFATRLMRKTNTRVVQRLLGHKSLTSTQVYTHPNSQDLSNAIESLGD